MSRSSLVEKVRELKDVLEIDGISDSGRSYRVYYFTSAHVGDNRLSSVLNDLFYELEMVENENR